MLKNNMEEVVFYAVNVMLKETNDNFWKNDIHKNDLACYVLNRLKPMYVTSGRGVIHSESKLDKNLQEHVDIFALVAKGMRVIYSRRKGDEITSQEQTISKDYKNEGYYFHFPCFVGKIISLDTWEEVSGIAVTLKYKTNSSYKSVAMINSLWHNPYIISDKTSGYYTFYPKPIEDNYNNSTTRKFELLIVAEQPNSQKVKKSFKIERTSERMKKASLQKETTYRIEDFYIGKG